MIIFSNNWIESSSQTIANLGKESYKLVLVVDSWCQFFVSC